MASISPSPKLQFFDANGAPLSGGKLYTYAAGTTTPLATYTDYGAGTPNANPVILDSRGEANVWLGSLAYKMALKTPADASVWTVDNMNHGDTATLAVLAASGGSALVGYINGGSGAVATTVQAKLRESVSVLDFGAVGDGTTDDTAAIQAAIDAVSTAGGGTVYVPAGTYRHNSTITIKTKVNFIGAGKNESILKYYGSAIAIDARGANTSNRVICNIADIKFDGTNSTGNAEGINCAWNMRSMPLLQRVFIYNFPHYGIHFTDQEWIVAFVDVEVDQCGHTTANSSGIYKDTSIDASTFNTITFTRCVVEGCGNATSTAGGINMQTTTSTRGISFTDCCVEGNFGSNEIYITNTADLQLINMYIERLDVAGQVNAIELSGCSGGIFGGFIAGENISTNLRAFRLTNCSFYIAGILTQTWGTAGIVNEGSVITTGWNNTTYYTGNATAQWRGEHAPDVSVHKNGVNQTGITTGSFQKVTFSTEIYDTTDAFASSTFTPQSLGKYQVDACVNFTVGVDQTRYIASIYVNGSVNKSVVVQASGTGALSIPIAAIVNISATTDYIEIYVRQDSGSDKIISGQADETYFMGTYLRP